MTGKMILKKVWIIGMLIFAMVSAVTAQESGTGTESSPEIYIEQSNSEDTELPSNRSDLEEVLVLAENNIHSISLRYPEQQYVLNNDEPENLHWPSGKRGAGGKEGSIITEGSDDNNNNPLAQMLGEAISGHGNRAELESNPDDDEIEAFRKVFEAVMKEEKQADAKADDQPVLYKDVDGMVLNETRSKTGQDFYSLFYESWTKPGATDNYIIRVAEKPGPGMGSIIVVEVNYEEVVEFRLRPGDQQMIKAAVFAANRVNSYLNEKSENPLIY